VGGKGAAGSVARRVVQLVGITLLQGVLLLGSAGTLAWPAAWAYLALYVLLLLLGGLVLRGSRREVIAQRSRGTAGAMGWDLRITRLIRFASFAVLVVAGLAQRLGWAPSFGPTVQGIGAALFVVGFALVLWAMAVNRFFAQVVRIQAERGHLVVTTGPYRYVRHPGYVGMICSMAGTVLLLGSPWAGLPAAAYVALMIVRTAKEDDTLADRLPGYGDYRRATRYRLLPGAW
jgi:protein-S-isoprenylcysteine O-methyltransferase Ste14